MVASQDIVLKGSWSEFGNPSQSQAPVTGRNQMCLGKV